ncbi:MAG TPA: hypothetical protein VIK73_10205 [Limnochordales bacterium]
MSGALPDRPWTQVLAEEVRPLLEALAEAARRRGTPAYVVGGAVRDWLLGRGPIREADIVVVGDARALAEEAATHVGGRVVAFERFGTVRLAARRLYVDVATARVERYPAPGALPVPSPARSIEEDLVRRDFSINAMAVPVAGDGRPLIDPCGGLQDLQSRRLRALHPRSFEDDPTRLFRGVRLAVRLGLAIDAQTAGWMQQAIAARAVETVSAERRGQEVRRALSEQPALPVAQAFERWGLWDAACPGWRLEPEAERVLAVLDEDAASFEALLEALAGPSGSQHLWAVRLVAVAAPWLTGPPERVQQRVYRLVERLALTRELRESLLQVPTVRRRQRRLAGARRPSTADRLLQDLSTLSRVYLAARGGPTSPDYNWVGWWARVGRHVRPRLTGRDLLALGCPEGPAVGRMQRALRAAVLDGRVRSRAEEQRWVRRLLQAWRRVSIDSP